MRRISFRALSVVLGIAATAIVMATSVQLLALVLGIAAPAATAIVMATSVQWLALVLFIAAFAAKVADRWRPGLAIAMIRPGMKPVSGGQVTEKWSLRLLPARESWMLAEPVDVEGSVECPRIGLRMKFSFFADSPAGINFLHGLVNRHESVGEWVEAELSRPGELFDRPCFSDKGPAYDVEEALYDLLKTEGAKGVEIDDLGVINKNSVGPDSFSNPP